MDPVIYKSVANFVFGFLIVTVRSYVAAKLRNGDLADRKIGAMFASPLDKMLAKLFEISHQELRISITHLKQGIRRLNLVLGGDIFYSARKSSSQVNVVKISHAASETVKEVLVHHEENKDDYQKGHKYDLYLKRKKEAIESFKQAAVEALKALCNRDLEPEEHIIASYVLLACTILGNLDDREQAVIDCWGNLEELHDIPAIHKTFLAHANGGWRSRFLKESRNKIIESIVDIHSIIFYFISKFSEKRIGVLDWPMVGCDTLAINPILYQETKLYYNLKDKKEDHPSLWQSNKLNDKEIPNPSLNCSFDSKGNLVCILTNKDEKHVLGKLNSTSGELQQFSSSIDVTSKDIEYCSVAVDDDDQVYLLSRHDSCYKLSVYTKDGILSYHRRLTFLKGRVLCYLAVTKEKKIVICCENDFGENIVYLYKTSEDHPLHNEEYTTLARSHSIMLQNVGYTARSTTHSTQPQSEESSTRSTSHSTPPQNEESSTRSTSHSTPPQNEESSARSTSQTKRFALNLKNHSIEGMFVSRDNEIIIAAINYTEKSRELYIYIYSEDGYRKTSLKFRPSKGNNCYLSICWDQDSKDIIGYTVSNDRIFVDHLSVETGEIHCSYLLNSMNFPDNISSFHLVCHANGRLALVQEKHVILLRSK